MMSVSTELIHFELPRLDSDLDKSVLARPERRQGILGLVVTKPVFGVSDKVRFKPVSFATETS